MADFPYTPQPGKIKDLFLKVQNAGVPDKVTLKYLTSIGLKSTNDRYLVSVLKFIGFIDSSNIPTDKWTQYRSKKKAEEVLGEAIKTSYSSLFQTYPEAQNESKETLRDFFSSHTTVAESTLDYIVRTFQSLIKLARFDGKVVEEPKSLTGAKLSPSVSQPHLGTKQPVSINVNIELHLPATEDQSIYDKLFESLKKHILS
jgi:hypothetical protein